MQATITTMIPSARSLGLHAYAIESKHDETRIVISAKSAGQAWSKFVAQRFGALKPSRRDWTVTVQS